MENKKNMIWTLKYVFTVHIYWHICAVYPSSIISYCVCICWGLSLIFSIFFPWQTRTSSTWPSRPSGPLYKIPPPWPSAISPRSPSPAESRRSTSRSPPRSGRGLQSCLSLSSSSWTPQTSSQNPPPPVQEGQLRWTRWPPSPPRVSVSCTVVPDVPVFCDQVSVIGD